MEETIILEELYCQLNDNSKSWDPRADIEMIESNYDLVFNTYTDNTDENKRYVILIITVYARALSEMKSYRKALPYLNKAIFLRENNDSFLNNNYDNVMMYAQLRFDRGRAYYYQKDIEKAKLDFTWLAKHYPENDFYKAWMVAIKNKRFEQIGRALTYIAIAGMVILFLIPHKERAVRLNIAMACEGLIAASLTLFAIAAMRRKLANKG